MFRNEYYLNLIRNQSINYEGLVLDIIPLKKVCELGLDHFDHIITPFALTNSCFQTPVESIFKQAILTTPDLLTSLIEYLQIATHFTICRPFTDHIDLLFGDGRSFRIDDSNFEDICDIILKMNGKAKIVIEKQPNTKSTRKLEIWKKLSEGRKKFEEKNKVHLYDMLNVCEFGGEFHIPISEMDNWSLWKIGSCYSSRVGWKSYNDALDIALVSGDSKNITGDHHWHKQLMLRD